MFKCLNVSQKDDSMFPLSVLYGALGRGLISHPPPKDQRLPLLNDVWNHVRHIHDLTQYTKCAVIYIELLLKHYSEKEVLILLKDVVKHVKNASSQSRQDVMSYLELIIGAIVKSTSDFGLIVTSDHFLYIMDLFRETKQVEVCKYMLKSFSEKENTTSDPILIHALFDFARSLHDSIDSLSFDDERKQISKLICRFVT